MLDGALEAIGLFFTMEIVLILLAGTAIGFVVALLPGIGGSVTMAILLPVTFGMEPTKALMFLVAIMSAGGFAGAVTQILMRVPGDSNVASMLDGYPMAREGKGSEAIGAAVGASTLGALCGIGLLILSLPLMRQLALLFGPPELFVVALAGVLLIAAMSTDRQVGKAVLSGGIGMMAGTVGVNLITGEVRFTHGQHVMYDGIPLVPVLAGIFAIPEVFKLVQRNESVSLSGSLSKGGVLRGFIIAVKRPLLVLQSSAIGAGIGAIPGVGSSVSTWIAYYAAQATSKSRHTFGKGNIEGVIAPEASRDAREGGSMIPLLALGIPGGVATAVLLTGFLIHGVDTGPRLLETNMTLVWALILTILWANVVTGMFGLLTANQIAKVTLVPVRVLVPIVLAMILIGSYVVTRSYYGMLVTIIAGILGMVMVRLGYARPPLILGLILLPIMERNYYSSMQIHRSYDWILSPTVSTIIALTIIAGAGPHLWRRLRRRSRKAVADGPLPPSEPPELPAEPVTPAGSTLTQNGAPTAVREEASAPTTWQLAFYVVVLSGTLYLLYSAFDYSPDGRQFPVGILVMMAVLLMIGAVKSAAELRVFGGRRFMDAVRPPPDPDASRNVYTFTQTAVWMSAMPLLMWVFGMQTGLFMFAFAFMMFYERRSHILWRAGTAAVGAGLIIAAVHYVFVDTLGIRLSSGLL